MKNLKSFLLFIFIGIALQGYSQTSFWVQLQKQQQQPSYAFSNNLIYEIEDISEFKLPEGVHDVVIGYLKLSEFHDLYNERHLSKAHLSKYKTLIKKYQN